MTYFKQVRRAALIVSLASVAGLAACGGGDSSDTVFQTAQQEREAAALQAARAANADAVGRITNERAGRNQ